MKIKETIVKEFLFLINLITKLAIVITFLYGLISILGAILNAFWHINIIW